MISQANPSRPARSVFWLTAAALALTLPAPADAASLHMFAMVSGGGDGIDIGDKQTRQNTTLAYETAGVPILGTSFSSQAVASGQAKQLQLLSVASASAQGSAYAFAYAQGEVSAAVTTSSPTVAPGAVMVVQASFRMSGSLTASGSGAYPHYMSIVAFSFYVANNHIIGTYGRIADGEPTDSPEVGEFVIEYAVQAGVPHNYTLYGYTDASATVTDGSASATAEFDSTFEWLGVTRVTDINGNQITDYTMIDDVGTDWTTPVPEPGSMSLLAAAAGLTLCGRRRCRNHRR